MENDGAIKQSRASAADGVPVKISGGQVVIATVFNIKGNEYRLIATVNFGLSVVIVREVLTPAQYSKNDWKRRL
ncbi:MAG TPA: type II toxin-antitoxin system HigB family toxin [Tepidisphaeraceae bacterium]|nr:type II toxin-antitoxin system HigB family toxin [Tepidisphaeraceae bacterium]